MTTGAHVKTEDPDDAETLKADDQAMKIVAETLKADVNIEEAPAKEAPHKKKNASAQQSAPARKKAKAH